MTSTAREAVIVTHLAAFVVGALFAVGIMVAAAAVFSGVLP